MGRKTDLSTIWTSSRPILIVRARARRVKRSGKFAGTKRPLPLARAGASSGGGVTGGDSTFKTAVAYGYRCFISAGAGADRIDGTGRRTCGHSDSTAVAVATARRCKATCHRGWADCRNLRVVPSHVFGFESLTFETGYLLTQFDDAGLVGRVRSQGIGALAGQPA